MRKLLTVLLGATALSAVVMLSVAGAGLQPNAIAKLQWYNDATCVVHGGNYDPLVEPQGFTTPTFLVSASGLNFFRGASVQIVIEGLSADGQSATTLPASWQAQTGGCAKPRLNISKGSAFASCFFSAWDAVPTLAVGQEGMYYQFDNCVTPLGVGVFWLEAAGANGSNPPLTPATEYGLYSVSIAQNNTLTSTCAGNSTHGASPVCLYAWQRLPCALPPVGAFIAVTDSANALDYAAMSPGLGALTYNAPLNSHCPTSTRTRQTTWGILRRAYH